MCIDYYMSIISHKSFLKEYILWDSIYVNLKIGKVNLESFSQKFQRINVKMIKCQLIFLFTLSQIFISMKDPLRFQ